MSLFNSRAPQPFFSPEDWTWPKVRSLLGLAFLIAFALGMMFVGHLWLSRDSGLAHPFSLFAVAVLTLVGAHQGRYGLVLGIACFCFVLKIEPVLGTYWIATGTIYYLLIHWGGRWNTLLFWIFWVALGLFLPKLIFQNFQKEPVHYAWIQQAALAGFLLRYVWYWHEWKKNAWPRPAWFEHLSYICFVPQLCQALNYRPSMHWKQGPAYPNSIYQAYEPLGLGLLKIAILQTLVYFRVGPAYTGFSLETGAVWLQCGLVYGMAYLWLSCWYDLAIGLARLFGLNLPLAFRYPLLATSPIEFWRRFSIFNRSFIVELIYKPLGGSSHPARNIYLAFLAAALIFGSGWIGSRYWLPEAGTTLGWLLFMLVQATLVVLNHHWRAKRGLDRLHAALGWKVVPGWLLTQTAMALTFPLIAHSFGTPGMPDLDLSDRLIVLLTALGLRKPLL